MFDKDGYAFSVFTNFVLAFVIASLIVTILFFISF